MTIPIILDMDPGIDDAAALSVALNHPEIDIKLLTSVMGNVGVDKTTLNELKLVEFFDRQDVIVAKGAEKPLKKTYEDASYVHGASGMPGYDFPEVTKELDPRDAVTAMVDTLNAAEEPMIIVATGAYTNIANLVTKHPEVKSKIKKFVLMGGSISGGNVSSVAEFNVYSDPDAAKQVFESGVEIVMIGLDVTLKALLTNESMAKLPTLGRAGEMLSSLTSEYSDQTPAGKPMHDVNTIFYLIHPEAIKTEYYQVDVITEGPAIGATVADTQDRWSNGRKNVHVGVDIDADLFNSWYLEQVKNMG